MLNYKTLAAASLMSIVSTSCACAQCTECAIYPNRDPLNGLVETPAGKMGLERADGAAPAYTPSNANAGIRGYYLQRSGAPEAATPKIRMHHRR